MTQNWERQRHDPSVASPCWGKHHCELEGLTAQSVFWRRRITLVWSCLATEWTRGCLCKVSFPCDTNMEVQLPFRVKATSPCSTSTQCHLLPQEAASLSWHCYKWISSSAPVMMRDRRGEYCLLFPSTDWNALHSGGPCHTNLPNIQRSLPVCLAQMGLGFASWGSTISYKVSLLEYISFS